MLNQEIIDFITAERNAGKTFADITILLQQNGWQPDIIATTLQEYTTSIPTPSVPDVLQVPTTTSSEASTVSATKSKLTTKEQILKLGLVVALLGVCLFTSVKGPGLDRLLRMLGDDDAEKFFNVWSIAPGIIIVLILIGVSVLCTHFFIKRGLHPITALLTGVSSYVLGAFLFYLSAFEIVRLILKSAQPDIIFAISLLFSLYMMVWLSFIFIGFPISVIMLALVTNSRFSPTATKRLKLISTVTITVTIVVSLYIFGGVLPVAKLLKSEFLCNFVSSSAKQRECYLAAETTVIDKNSVNSAPETKPGTFVTEQLLVDTLPTIQIVGGKLAYTGKTDREPKIVFDGKELTYPGAVVSPLTLTLKEVNGKPAYMATINNKEVVIYDEKVYGEQYNNITNFVAIDNKIALLVRNGSAKTNDLEQFIVFDGQEIGRDYDRVTNLVEYRGKPAYAGQRGEDQFIVADDVTYGPFSNQSVRLTNTEGHLVSTVVLPASVSSDNTGTSLLFFDGKIYGENYTNVTNAEIIDDKLAFTARKGDEWYIVFEGKEYKTYPNARSYDVSGQLGYFAQTDAGIYLMVGTEQKSPLITDTIDAVAVSDQGQLAYTVEVSDDVHDVFFDGKKILTANVGPYFDFYGEKLVVPTFGDGLWYDGEILARGYKYFPQILIHNGKLIILATRQSDDGIAFDLLLEQ